MRKVRLLCPQIHRPFLGRCGITREGIRQGVLRVLAMHNMLMATGFDVASHYCTN